VVISINNVHTILDKSTQGDYGRGQMHVCPNGWYMRGLHDGNNWLICSDGASLDPSFLRVALEDVPSVERKVDRLLNFALTVLPEI
jgi:hypothetical protein